MKKLTIFTPTYNRAYIIEKLYKSLCAQSNKDFCWLIVDDGSSDNTAEIVKSFQEEGILDIDFFYQTNGGKHTAMMRGIAECHTELFFCVDSDDYLSDDAVEVVLSKHSLFAQEKLLGYYFRRIYPNGVIVADLYPKGIAEVGITELYHRYNYKGDTAIVLRTQYLHEARFPLFENERFVTERVFYNQLNNIAPMKLFEDGIYISDYLTDGYTKNEKKLIANNPYGYAVDCLFESYYGIGSIYKSKKYAEYLGFVKVFGLKRAEFSKYNHTAIYIRISALLGLRHYIKLAKMYYSYI